MARQIIRPSDQKKVSRHQVRDNSPQTTTRTDTGHRIRRQRRSPAYIQLIKGLDTSLAGGSSDVSDLEEIIRQEFPEFGEFLPKGYVAQCYLGHPFEVHTVDRTGHSIIDHYHIGHPLPNGLEVARRLALHPSYELIEVYEDRMVAVMSDGSVVDLEV